MATKELSFLANDRLPYSCAGLEEMNLAENCVSWRNKPVSHSKSRSLRSREKAKRTIFPNSEATPLSRAFGFGLSLGADSASSNYRSLVKDTGYLGVTGCGEPSSCKYSISLCVGVLGLLSPSASASFSDREPLSIALEKYAWHSFSKIPFVSPFS